MPNRRGMALSATLFALASAAFVVNALLEQRSSSYFVAAGLAGVAMALAWRAKRAR